MIHCWDVKKEYIFSICMYNWQLFRLRLWCYIEYVTLFKIFQNVNNVEDIREYTIKIASDDWLSTSRPWMQCSCWCADCASRRARRPSGCRSRWWRWRSWRPRGGRTRRSTRRPPLACSWALWGAAGRSSGARWRMALAWTDGSCGCWPWRWASWRSSPLSSRPTCARWCSVWSKTTNKKWIK